MKKVITYGTYDLLHEGHLNLLREAKAMGDYLIVGVTSDSFDRNRGKLNVRQDVLRRIDAVRATGLADEVVIEDYLGQKIDDIQRFDIDIFAIGSDWDGQFNYLTEYCHVVYITRTEGISSTLIRDGQQRIYQLGIVGSGRIACRFVPEAGFVKGVHVSAVYNPSMEETNKFAAKFDLEAFYISYAEFLEAVDAVYIASPHLSHYYYIKEALLAGRHVLCEIPLVLSGSEAEELYALAKVQDLVLLEASKTAFCPAFIHLVNMLKSGIVGDVVDIQASLSKLQEYPSREFDVNQAGGSITELAPLPLLAMVKILGSAPLSAHFFSKIENEVDVFTKGIFYYGYAVATITLGLGVKTEGNLVISGTKGYIYVPSPWWKTDFFEICFEDKNKNRKFFYPFSGDGLRYEIQEFISMIDGQRTSSFKMKPSESICIANIIEDYRSGSNVTLLKN